MEASMNEVATEPGGAASKAQVTLTTTPGEDPRDSLQALLGSLQNFGAGAAPQSLDQLAGAWRSVDPGARASSSAPAANAAGSLAGDALQDYLDANPFRGTFVFSDDAIAMLGANAVRVGQELLEGDAVVARIEQQKVTISYRGIPREFVLPPLRATTRGSASSATGSVGGGSGAAMDTDPMAVPAPPPIN
ncbi:MAG: hypothetical protein R3F49_00980 [Planctomycetota bacterium]